MKKIFLARHSVPERGLKVLNKEIPLSNEGRGNALVFFSNKRFSDISKVYASDYKRAYETALYSFGNYEIDKRLGERELGNKETLTEEFWEKQYRDHDYKNTGGESFNEVSLRMNSVIAEILFNLKEEESAVVVSHAAAICSFLMSFCDVDVVDANEKIRKFTFDGNVFYCGKIKTPSCFCISYENEKVISIEYFE